MTARVPLLDRATAPIDSKPVLDQIHGAFGTAPNMFRAVANSPAALTSMWAAFGALGHGRIPAQLGEKIAVAVADRNRCEYCLAAHTALGKKAGASGHDMAEAQAGRAADAKTAAALTFALSWSSSAARLATPMCRHCARPASTMARSSRSWRTLR